MRELIVELLRITERVSNDPFIDTFELIHEDKESAIVVFTFRQDRHCASQTFSVSITIQFETEWLADFVDKVNAVFETAKNIWEP